MGYKMNTRKKHLIIAVVTVIASLLLILSCTAEAEPPAGIDPPVIHTLQAQSERVFPSESIQIVCTASSPAGAELSYEWWASGGEIDGEDSIVTWTAPDAEAEYNIRVTVSDDGGGEAIEYLTIVVEANQTPVISSLTASADWVFPGGSLTVTCHAEDPDGHALSYEWSTSGGHIEATGHEVVWTAPGQVGSYTITVVVQDGHGGSDTRSLEVSVMSDQPPVIQALLVTANHKYLWYGELSKSYKVGRGQEYQIECIVSDTGIELFYQWSCTAGEASGEGSLMTWTAPDQDMTVRVTVVVSDIAGNTATESVELEVVDCGWFG